MPAASWSGSSRHAEGGQAVRATLLRAALALALLAVSCVAVAQTSQKLPQIGMINEFSPTHPFLAAFREELRELGYTEGQNVVVEFVSSGLVRSLAHPGGNATGISIVSPELIGKQLELLKTAVPRLTRVGALYNPTNPAADETLKAMRGAVRVLTLELRHRQVREPKDLPGAFAALTEGRTGALVIFADPMLGNELQQISKLASKYRLPAVYVRGEFAELGGFLAYGPSFADNYRRAATYVDRILKGARPSDLPVQQPRKFELVINLGTAKALGLTIPPSLMAQADRLIE
jgi:putative ABC transport system substrate-binding protein